MKIDIKIEGKPGCGKTIILRKIKEILGEDNFKWKFSDHKGYEQLVGEQ